MFPDQYVNQNPSYPQTAASVPSVIPDPFADVIFSLVLLVLIVGVMGAMLGRRP